MGSAISKATWASFFLKNNFSGGAFLFSRSKFAISARNSKRLFKKTEWLREVHFQGRYPKKGRSSVSRKSTFKVGIPKKLFFDGRPDSPKCCTVCTESRIIEYSTALWPTRQAKVLYCMHRIPVLCIQYSTLGDPTGQSAVLYAQNPGSVHTV